MTATTYTGPYTTSFTPNCANSASISGINDAKTAFDFFSTLSGASGNTGGVAALAIADPINKAIALSDGQQARGALCNSVKAQVFAAQFASLKSIIITGVNGAVSTLNSIKDPAYVNSISSLTPSYNADISLITSTLNNLKTLEIAANTPCTSIDLTSATIASNMLALPAQTTFATGSKFYVTSQLDPAAINGATIPALTAVNGNAGNAAALYTSYSAIATALSATKIVTAYQGEYLQAAQNIFDTHCMILGAYMASGSSNHGSGAGLSGAVGYAAGIDYTLTVTGVADAVSAGHNVGTPPDFWNYV